MLEKELPPMNVRIRNILARYGYIDNIAGTIDIEKISLAVSSGELLAMRNFSKASYAILVEWLKFAKAAQRRAQAGAESSENAGIACPHCGKPIILVAPETPRQQS